MQYPVCMIDGCGSAAHFCPEGQGRVSEVRVQEGAQMPGQDERVGSLQRTLGAGFTQIWAFGQAGCERVPQRRWFCKGLWLGWNLLGEGGLADLLGGDAEGGKEEAEC